MKITIMKLPFVSLIYEENNLSVVPAATVSIHGARLVAEPCLPAFPAEETTSIPLFVAWNDPMDMASLR
jgi:hypothetical protein